MQLSQKQKLSQKQALNLSPAMQQGLRVLRMSQIELYELVWEELNANPLLAEDETRYESVPEFLPVAASEPPRDVLFPEEREGWRGAGQDLSPLLSAHREQSFSEMLQEQIGFYALPELTERIARYLVECLDDRGYLDQDPAEIAGLLAVPLFEVMQALYFLQSLEPVGVGARSLEECLTLQLAQGTDFNEYTLRIVSGGLRLLAQNRLSAIAKLLRTDLKRAQQSCDVVRSLNPIPSRGYRTGESPACIVPDAAVYCSGSEICFQLNRSFVPNLIINQAYAQLLPTLSAGQDRDYIARHLAEADMLIRSVAQRNNTLQRVILCMVGMQPSFFKEGRGLLPMSMADVAGRLDLSVSTVSRAIQDKYVVCRRGVVSLRSLFTTGYTGETGQAAVSPDTVKEKLQFFVAAEDPAQPLSDTMLCEALRNVGIHVARRTLAKYRGELGIRSSQERRRG